MLRECRAELDRCVDVLGRAPDVGVEMGDDSPFAAAVGQASREYGMGRPATGSRLRRDLATGGNHPAARGPAV